MGIGETKEARLSVLKAASRKLVKRLRETLISGVKLVNPFRMKLGSDVSLAEIVDICPKNMSGADFYSLCASAVTNGIARMICQLESGRNNISSLSSTGPAALVIT